VGLSGGSIFRKKENGHLGLHLKEKDFMWCSSGRKNTKEKRQSWESGTMRSDRVNAQCERLNVTNYEAVVICADL
jgi:hypothetical protein